MVPRGFEHTKSTNDTFGIIFKIKNFDPWRLGSRHFCF